jgi:hypothetical protein
MRIAADGNVGIGTTSPAYKLDVAGSVYSSNYFSVLTAATYGPSDNSAAMQVFGSTGSGGLTNTIKFVTGGSERVRIDASGNFGIGTTSPDSRLHVYSTSWEPTIRLTSTSGSVKTYGLVNNPYWATGSFHIYDFTTDNSRIHISSGGNIGIAVGSATPANRLDVVGDFRVRASGAAMILDTAATSDGRMEYKYNGTRKALIGVDSNNLQISVDSGNYLQFRTNSTERVRIADDGNVGIGTSSPASKLTVQEIGTDGTPAIRLITTSAPSTFSWFMSAMNSSLTAGKNYIGLIGQAESQNNSGYIGFNYQGAGSTSNFLTFGFYQNDNLLNLRASGNVGIGTTAPAAKLDIVGTNSTIALSFGNTVPNNPLFINTYGGAQGIGMDSADAGIRLVGDYASGGNRLVDIGYYSSGTVAHANWVSRLRVLNNGNVGIGTTSPAAKLDVAGNSKLGSSISNAHQITGSLSITGSVSGINTESFHPFLLG